MSEIWMDVDAAVTVPVNILPLIAVADFKAVLASETYNEAGLDLIWNFVTTAGVQSHTAITPTDTGGTYDWVNVGHGMYNIELPAAVNNTEGFGWFTGVATDALPWRGPIIGFRDAALNNLLIDTALSATRGLAGTALPAAAADAAGGLPISDAGGLDMDAILARIGTPGNLGGGTSTLAGNLADIEAQTDDIGVAGAGLTALATAAELAKVPKSDAAVTWNATALASINAEVDAALNTAIPGSPTADSVNQRIAALDDLTQASGGGDLAAIKGYVDDIGVAGAGLTALATAAELAKVPKSDSNVTWNATALASINAEVDGALNTAIPGSPTADSVNERVKAIDDLTQASGSGDLAALLTRIGTPANIDSGGATLADNLKKLADDNGGASFDATVSSLNKLSTAVITGVPSTLQASANIETTGTLISGTYASTYLSNGTSWVTAPVTPAVAEAGSTLSPFGLNVNLLYTAGASQTINSVSIRGNFNAGAGRYCNVYAYNYLTTTWDMLSDVGTRMNNTGTLTNYSFGLLSSHQKATAAVATTSDGSNFVGVTTTCTASVTGHGFVTGDIVTISGITTLTNANGTFMVTRTNNDVFTYRIASQSATGGGTAAMTTDALGAIRIGFKSPSVTTGDRLNADLSLVNVATANPSTADIADAVYAKMATSVYGRQVWIDTVNGVDGYVIGVNGLDHTPVLTIACAYQLCDDLGLKTIAFKSGSNATAVTLTRSAAGWRFYGPGKIDLNGQIIADAIFEECYSVYGTSTGDDASFYRCQIGSGGLTLDHAYVTACRIKGAITLIANEDPIIFHGCIDATGAAVDFALIFVDGATAIIRDFQGALTLKDMAATNSVVIDGACRLTIDASSTAGAITLRGFADAPTGASVFVTAPNTGTITQTARFDTSNVADAILARDIGSGTGAGTSEERTVRAALRFLRNKRSIAAGTLTVTKEDDSAAAWTAAVTTSAAAEPVTAIDPAGP